jgi:tetratricopeptide (TPR) repeat protein
VDAGAAHAPVASALQTTNAPKPRNAEPAHPAGGGTSGSSASPPIAAPKPATPIGPPKPATPNASTATGETVTDETASDYAHRGEALLERGSVPAAAHAFERALELDPGMPRAKVGLGYVALERAQPANAVGLFRAAASAGSSEALIGLGDAYRRLGKLRAALAAYREYVERYPRGERGSIARHQIELLTEQLATDG